MIERKQRYVFDHPTEEQRRNGIRLVMRAHIVETCGNQKIDDPEPASEQASKFDREMMLLTIEGQKRTIVAEFNDKVAEMMKQRDAALEDCDARTAALNAFTPKDEVAETGGVGNVVTETARPVTER